MIQEKRRGQEKITIYHLLFVKVIKYNLAWIENYSIFKEGDFNFCMMCDRLVFESHNSREKEEEKFIIQFWDFFFFGYSKVVVIHNIYFRMRLPMMFKLFFLRIFFSFFLDDEMGERAYSVNNIRYEKFYFYLLCCRNTNPW